MGENQNTEFIRQIKMRYREICEIILPLDVGNKQKINISMRTDRQTDCLFTVGHTTKIEEDHRVSDSGDELQFDIQWGIRRCQINVSMRYSRAVHLSQSITCEEEQQQHEDRERSQSRNHSGR